MNKGSVKAGPFPVSVSEVGGGENGDPSSLAYLYQRYWQELCVYVRRSFGGGPPEPEDVVQAAFVRYAAVPDKAAVQNPRAFLYTAARNIVIDHRRHDRTVGRHARDVLNTTVDDSASEITPERVLIGKERLHQLLEYLQRMPEHRRRVVLLNRMEGLSVREIADLFGLAENTARKQIARAVTDCLKHLKEPDIDDAGPKSEK